MDGMSDIRNEIEQRLGVFARQSAKAAFAENVTYSVAVHIGDQPAGERSTKSLDEAKAYAKAMLQTAKANAKGKPVVVDVYPVVNYEPKDAVLTLRASRPGAKATMGKKYVLTLKSNRTGHVIEFPTEARNEADAKMAAYALYGDAWKVVSIAMQNSRPGAKAEMAKFKVGDRIAYKPFPNKMAGEIVAVHEPSASGDIQRRGKADTLEVTYDVRLPGGGVAQIAEGMAIRASRPGAKATFAIPAKWQSEDRYIDQRVQQADEPNAPSFKQGKYIAYVHYRNRSVQVDNMLRRTPPGQYRNELEAYLASVDQKIAKYKNSRPGAKATMGKYWVEDGQSNVKQPVKSMREGIQLVSGMQNGVLRYADHGMTSILAYGRGSGGASLTEDGKLHQKHASSRPGEKATFAFPGIVVKEDAQYIYYYPDEDDRATFADADGKGAYTVKSNRTGKPVSAKTYRSWDEAVSASNAINEKLPPLKKRKRFSRPGAKATAAKPDDKTECADCETEQDKAGLKLMEKADKAVSDKIRTLIKEGKPQDQAVAIALDMKRRGEL